MTIAKIFGVSDNSEWSRPSVIALILANLIPVFGVLFLGWELYPLMLLFWMENVIVGVFAIFKMICAICAGAGGGGYVRRVAQLLGVICFCLLYGFVAFLHGVFVVGVFGGVKLAGNITAGKALLDFANEAASLVPRQQLILAVAGLFLSHAFSFATNFLGRAEYKTANPDLLMNAPLGRMVVLHVTILASGFFVGVLHSPLWGLLLLVVLKVALDLRGHLNERKKFAEATA